MPEDDLMAIDRLDPVVREQLELGPSIDWDTMGPTAARIELLRQLDRNFARWGAHFPPVASEFEELTADAGSVAGEATRAAVATGVPAAGIDAAAAHSHSPVRLRIFRPRPGAALGVHVLLHGGGWRGGSIDEQCTVHSARRIAAEADVVVVTAGYRLAPEHPWPAALADVLDTVAHLVRSADTLDVDPSSLTLGGVSAGANLAAAATLAGPLAPVRGLILEVPALDLTGDTIIRTEPTSSLAAAQGVLTDYVPDRAGRSDPLVSPLLAKDAGSFPPSWLVSAGLDPLRHDAAAFAARLRAAGVPVDHTEIDGALHGSGILTKAWPPARRWQDAVVAAVRAAHDVPGRN